MEESTQLLEIFNSMSELLKLAFVMLIAAWSLCVARGVCLCMHGAVGRAAAVRRGVVAVGLVR